MTSYRLSNGDVIKFASSSDIPSRVLPDEEVCTYRCTTSLPATAERNAESDGSCVRSLRVLMHSQHTSSMDHMKSLAFQLCHKKILSSSSVVGTTTTTGTALSDCPQCASEDDISNPAVCRAFSRFWLCPAFLMQ